MIQMNAPDMDTNEQEIDLIELAKRLWGNASSCSNAVESQ